MRKQIGVWLLALVGLARLAASALAGHCGAVRYPRRCVTADQCAAPCVTSTVQYQAVIEQHQQVCYRPVSKTEYRPETYTTQRVVRETTYTTEKYTVQRPVTEYFDTVRCYTVMKPVYETHLQQQTYTVFKPVTRTFQVAIPYCVMKPIYETHVKDVTQTICRPQWTEYTV